MTANHSYQERTKVEKQIELKLTQLNPERLRYDFGLQKSYYIYAENGTKNWLKLLTKEQMENESQLLVTFTVILHQLSHGMRTSQMYQYPWVCRQWCSLSRIFVKCCKILACLVENVDVWMTLSDGHLQPTQKLVHRYSNPSNLLTSRTN